MGETRPPLEYLATCSQMSLESVELSRLNRAANLRKEFQELLQEWIDTEVDARLARSILEWRRSQISTAGGPRRPATPSLPAQFGQLAMDLRSNIDDSSALDSAGHEAQVPRTPRRSQRELPSPGNHPKRICGASRPSSLASATAGRLGKLVPLEQGQGQNPRTAARIALSGQVAGALRQCDRTGNELGAIREPAAPIEFAPLRHYFDPLTKPLKPVRTVAKLARRRNGFSPTAVSVRIRYANP
jgi:hypothetical protein